MNYDVLDESKNAINNLEENAFENHKEDYVATKAAADEFNDRRDYEELVIKEANSQEEIDHAQDELTKIIDDVIEFNDSFNSSIMPVDDTNPLMEVEEPTVEEEQPSEIDTTALDTFLNNVSEE